MEPEGTKLTEDDINDLPDTLSGLKMEPKGTKLTEDDINDLPDTLSGLKLLKSLGLDAKGVKSTDDVRQRLRKHMTSTQIEVGTPGGSGEPSNRVNADKIRDLIVAQTEGCRKLLSVLKDLEDFVSKLPDGKVKDDLFEAIPDTNDRLQRAKDSLESDEFSILVAGDTGSGKSSFLNLLLDECDTNILPVAHTSSTSAICEIRYGKEMALEVKKKDSTEFTKISINDKEHALKEISNYTHQRGMRDEEFKYDTVRIYWPVEWLQHNIMIVDTPGIAENPELTKMVKEYIPKASGFIYVINPTIDGGFSPDKLRDLLTSHLKTERRDKEEHAFDHRSAIFVCNKWDDIKKKEKEEMIDHIKTNLNDIWPGFSQEHLFFFSTKQAVASLKVNFIPDDYTKLLLGLERLLPIACQNRLTKQYWSVREVINRANLTLRLDLMAHNVEEIKEDEKFCQIVKDLDRIQQNQAKIKLELHDMAALEVQTTMDKLKLYLFGTMSNKLLEWEERDCPKAPRINEDLGHELVHAANLRIRKCIEEWAVQNNVFEEIEQKIDDKFNSQFYELKAELDFIENYTLIPGNAKIKFVPENTHFKSSYGVPETQKDLKTFIKELFGIPMPFWARLSFAMGFTAIGNLGNWDFFKKREAEMKVKAYNENKASKMKEITQYLLSKLLDNNELKAVFSDSINELHKSINNLLSRLPNIIRANRKLAEQRLKPVAAVSTCTKELYEGIYKTGFDLENEINTIYLNHIKMYDIELEDLEPRSWERVGKGHFSVVFAANYKGGKVAVKRPNCPACGYTSTNFILEETNFRHLKMPNIVTFYGTAVQRRENCVYPLLVLEHCQCSLDKIVLQADKYRAPGRVCIQEERENGEVYRNTARYGMDISCALKSLHNLGYVHRDLKLENILVDAEGRVKLADLGLCKPEADITGSLAGTPIYMAPEVQIEKMYNHSADIFSLGMVIWELWYGMCVVRKYNQSNLEEFKENCFMEFAPPKTWMELIENCLQMDPNVRPTADDVYKFFCVASKPANAATNLNELRK